MSRSRGSEMSSQRQSPRVPLHLKTTACSESNGGVRHSVDRSPKLDDHRRSPRSPLPEKKRGTRVAELETKLTQKQEELKKLKEQLALTENAKRNAELELEETKKRIPTTGENTLPPKEATTEEKNGLPEPLLVEESINSPATDVFEVVLSVATEPEISEEVDSHKEEVETKPMIEESPNGNPEISELNAKLVDMEKVIETLAAESESLKKQVEEAKENVANSKTKEDEIGAKLVKMEEELSESRAKGKRLGEQLEAVEVAKSALEAEMKTLRVQTEQWRKAAEAAAAVLSTGEDGNERRVPEGCGSGVDGFIGSPGMEEEGFGGGKRKTGGMRMFWKKGQK